MFIPISGKLTKKCLTTTAFEPTHALHIPCILDPVAIPIIFCTYSNLIVISKVQPTVRHTYFERTLRYGSRHRLPCFANSGGVYIYPDRYGWFKDGERMQTSSSSRSMLIGPVHYQDTGIYTCIMKNSVGSVNVTYNVTVFGERIFYSFLL